MIPRYLACSRVTKRPIFVFVCSTVRPGDALQVFALADDYSFGILQSCVHWQWFVAKCSKLTERLRYNGDSVFQTFPWPQSPSNSAVSAVADAGRKLRGLRAQAKADHEMDLRSLYRTLDMPGKNPLKRAHEALDIAVLNAYGFSRKKDILQQTLNLNEAVANAITNGNPTLAPGVPPTYAKPGALVSADCLGT